MRKEKVINQELEEKYLILEKEHEEKINKKRESSTGFKRKWIEFTQLGLFQFLRKKWSKFSLYHPVLSKWIYQLFYFFVFSNGVTIWQYLVMLFLPNLFGSKLASIEFIWPQVKLWTWSDGTPMIFGIFNEPVKYIDGVVQIGGGLGNFIAFEIAVFTAQCINFPLQRNITFKSDGNPFIQALWYFIGWVLISILVNAVWGFVGPVFGHIITDEKAITDLLKTFITGGLSMVVFFFLFRENNFEYKEENNHR